MSPGLRSPYIYYDYIVSLRLPLFNTKLHYLYILCTLLTNKCTLINLAIKTLRELPELSSELPRRQQSFYTTILFH